MPFVLGTTHRIVRWYQFTPKTDDQIDIEFHDVLDLTKVTQFETRNAARNCIARSGLGTWRYFKF